MTSNQIKFYIWFFFSFAQNTSPISRNLCFQIFHQTKKNKDILFLFFSSIKTEPDEYEYDFESKPTLFKGIGDLYEELPNEAIILNTIGAALVGLAILMPCILKCDAFKKGLQPEAGEGSEDEEDWKNQKNSTQHCSSPFLVHWIFNKPKKGLEPKAREDSDIEWTKKYLVLWNKKTQHIERHFFIAQWVKIHF